MPHVDLQALEDLSQLACDLCIIGTGPAGSTVARELSSSGLRIVVLESGSFTRQPSADALNEIESVGRPRVMDQWLVRNRIVGGTSHTWTGRCAPFDEIDFEQRAWIPYSGWPFGLDHLTPFLDRTAPYLGLGIGSGFTGDRFWELAGQTPPTRQPDPETLRSFFWQSSRDETSRRDFMRSGRHLLGYLGQNITLVSNATVLGIHTNEAGTAVTSLTVASLDGRRHRLLTRAVVLSAGAIENARLLLCSKDTMPGGLGNINDQVGRYLMDHPRDTVGSFPRTSRRLQKQFGFFRARTSSGEIFFRRGLRLSPGLQRKEELVNCAAFLRETNAPDDPWDAVIRLLNGEGRRRRHALTIAKSPRHTVRALHNYFVATNSMPHKIKRLDLVCMCEQVPDPESRVTLSRTRDRLGMPISRINWRTHEREARTVRRMAESIHSEFTRLGEEAPVLDSWIRKGEPFPPHTFSDVAHPTGTTRISVDPRCGVVDPDCQVHGVHGLYLAGSSVFPTSGHCNPTQMIVALAIRLADTLKLRLPAMPLSASLSAGILQQQ